VKFKTEVLTSLVDAEDPVDPVWEAVWNIWAPAGDDIASHYSREPEMVEYERLLLDVYSEFYTETLTDRCVNQASMNVPEEGALIMMDSMSVREASLFVQFLEDKASELSVGYSYSTVPSETMPFRDRVGYSDLKKEYKTARVQSQEPSLDGDERIIWSRYPDALLENIQEGRTKLSSIEEMYEKSETALRNIIDQLDTDSLVITSDHGYARLDSGHTFQISDRQKTRLQETFSGRFESVGEVNAYDLVEEGLVVEADGYYMPLGRYTWPAGGKYSNFQHGGLSVSECVTPRIKVTL
jgi:hypothetical protein